MVNKKSVQKDFKYYVKGLGCAIAIGVIDFTAKELKYYIKEKFFGK